MTGWDETEGLVGETSPVVDFVIAKPFKLQALLDAHAIRAQVLNWLFRTAEARPSDGPALMRHCQDLARPQPIACGTAARRGSARP
jgi:hypothetical protein